MRGTLFKQVNYTLGSLVQFIDIGQIGLPDIQRPFVWKNAKVRDLFDSMYRGYPVGYLLFWQNAFTEDHRTIGDDEKQKVPSLLIVDGQQRLTSLYAVFKGVAVLRKNYSTETIEIAFNPRTEQFEVADAAIRRDKSFIPNISVLWGSDADLFQLVDEYLADIGSDRENGVDLAEQRQIKQAIQRLSNLPNFPFTALELSSQVTEDQVAEVFVRVNSKGTPLIQADFILTLMSVFWDEGRAELETFCRAARTPTTGDPSPFNHYIQPDPDQLLRVAVGVGFKRARLQYVYSILRGKDLDTGEFSAERRELQFEVLKDAQTRTLRLTHWHDFFKVIAMAGYLGGRLISSDNSLLFTYVFYLVGRTEYDIEEHILRRVIAKWFFMASLTGRYTSSPESALEFDLARFREVESGEEYVSILERVCDSQLTSDFWTITLPNELATSSPRSPSLFAYYAALALLDAKPLFSEQKIHAMLDPSVHGTRSAVERHHLFSKAHLATLGITETRDTNQIANYALVEWGDNAAIAGHAPDEYLPEMRERVSPKELERMYYWHALPDGWETMEYRNFLERRRELIARVIGDAYARLAGAPPEDEHEQLSLEELVGSGETTTIEFKSTLRVNLHTGERDQRMEHACLKTIAGFLNSNGGTLIIGVSDDGTPVGIEADQFPNEDKMNLHLVNILKSRMGPEQMMYIHPRFEDYDGTRVMAVECWRARSPVFLKDSGVERFYIRTGAASTELSASQTQAYIERHFDR